MVAGGDLGFVLRVVVAAFVMLIGPVVGFLARRKWRRAAGGREEVERLVGLASEEEARAELEASAGYFYGYDDYGEGYVNGYGYGFRAEVEDQVSDVAVGASPAVAVESPGPVANSQSLMYPCAVCSSLTKARCKQCKAVHYCSGKCQIIHWRLGHKNECRPYSTADQNHVGVTSHLNVSKQEEKRSYGNGIEIEGKLSSRSVETSFGEPAFSNSVSALEHNGKSDIELEHFVDEKGRHPTSEFTSNSLNGSFACTGLSGSHSDVSHDFDESDRQLSNNHDVEKNQTGSAKIVQTKPSVSELPILVSSADSVHAASKSSQIKLGSVDAEKSCTPSTSPILGVSGSTKSSLCEPSTSSSGFWEGKLVRNRFRIDASDDSSHSCSSEADESNVSDSQSSSSESTKSVLPHVVTSDAKTVALDDSLLIMSDIRKPTDRTTSSVDEGKGDIVSRKSPKLTPEPLNYNAGSGSNAEPISKPGELVPPASGDGGKSMTEEIFKASGLPSSSTGKLNYGVESRTSSSDKLESRNIESGSSKAFEAPLSSNSGRHAVGSVKAVKSGNAQGTAACSLELGGHQKNAKSVSKTSVQGVVHQIKASTLTRQNTLGTISDIGTQYKGLFSYEMFVKLYNWNKFEFHPCGLVNCGNSCYANAVLQCLAFTPPLTSYFLQGLHSKSCEKKEWCFTCEFESLLLKGKEGISPLSPSQIISHLQDIGSHLSDGGEEDAHEFLRYAIDAMQSICLKEAGIKEFGSLEEATTLIGLTFGGYLRSRIECMRCGGKSVRHERMMDITVEIDGDIGTLEEALRQFSRTETLDGDNKYQCGRCKSYEKARKKLKVLEAPNVLSIVLKRFQSSTFGKLNKAIKFPEILNLAPYMSGTSDKSPIYRLYGVVVHLDIMNAAFSGHYVCYVKNIQNKWFKVDDSTVKEVELERVLTKDAYMLLYARCSPRAPRLIRSSLVPRVPRKPKLPKCEPRSFSTGSQGASPGDSLNGQPCDECNNSSHASFRPSGTIFEEDSSSDSSSFFSEVGSYSTDSSNRDSTSIDDPLDHMLSEMGVGWNSPWSDSETSSSSSSPSPLFQKQSPLADLDRYASAYPDNGGSHMHNQAPGSDSHRSPARSASSGNLEVSNSNKDVCIPSPDSTKQFRKLVRSSSSSKTDSDRLGQINPFDKAKPGVSFRRLSSDRQVNGRGE